MAGLILQVIVLVIFCAFFVDYMVRYVKRERKRTGSARQTIKPRQQLFLAALALSIVLILIRCGYRVDELSEGYQDSTKITHEGMFIGFEGVYVSPLLPMYDHFTNVVRRLIVAAVCCLFVGHPGFGFKHVEVKSADSGMESGDSAEPKTGA
jgi:FtsH-binding integral membrane protein